MAGCLTQQLPPLGIPDRHPADQPSDLLCSIGKGVFPAIAVRQTVLQRPDGVDEIGVGILQPLNGLELMRPRDLLRLPLRQLHLGGLARLRIGDSVHQRIELAQLLLYSRHMAHTTIGGLRLHVRDLARHLGGPIGKLHSPLRMFALRRKLLVDLIGPQFVLVGLVTDLR